MTAGLTYTPEYDLYLPLLDQVHPFDGRKYSRAYRLLEQRFGSRLDSLVSIIEQPADRELLLKVHSSQYLDSLGSATVLSKALELPLLQWVHSTVREARLLRPMRFAVQGTVEAVSRALCSGGIQVQLGGGFHHAFAAKGEGFCVYADAAIGIQHARSQGLLAATDIVLVIDLDAHRGNGIEDIFASDQRVRFLDLYNSQIYPGFLDATKEEQPYLVPLKPGTTDAVYSSILETTLPQFLNENRQARLAIYNAGTDVLAGDPLGRLALSEEGILARDRLVIDSLAALGIPAVVLPSGGYTSHSATLMAQTAGELLDRYAPATRA